MLELSIASHGSNRRSFTSLCFSTLALAACSSVKPPASTASPSPADQRAAAPAALGVERQWLQSWFKDTPVRIAQRNDGAVTVDVPVEYCFDAGRSTLKPALAAVLDRSEERRVGKECA